MNVLVLDQATNLSGYVVANENKKFIDFGVIDLSYMPKYTDEEQTEKRHELIKQISFLVSKYQIKMITTEGVYYHGNPDTHKKLSQVQGAIQDWCRNISLPCFSWKNAGEWRKYLGIGLRDRNDKKELTKQYVVDHYDVKNQVEDLIFNKYRNSKKHVCFNDLNKEIKGMQFDIYDSIGMLTAYFLMLEEKGLN